jgi:hypothetical protein
MADVTDQTVTAGSIAPGIYVAVKFKKETLDKIDEYQRRNNIPNPVPKEDLHSTIVYSRANIDWIPEERINLKVNTDTSVLETWDTRGGSRCLVWHYYSSFQHKRFDEAMAKGATYDFPEYKCHITLSYDVGDFNSDDLHKPDFPILLDYEIVEELDDPDADSSGPA